MTFFITSKVFSHLQLLFYTRSMLPQQVSFVMFGPLTLFHNRFSATSLSYALVSASCQLNWACNFIVGLCFPYLQEKLGPYSFVPFAIVLLITIVFVIVWLPETKGKSKIHKLMRLYQPVASHSSFQTKEQLRRSYVLKLSVVCHRCSLSAMTARMMIMRVALET